MNEKKIQATITLDLTREQLMTLLTSAPNVQTDAQTPEPVQVAPLPQMPVQAPPMPEMPPQMPVQQTPPVQMPTQQTPVQTPPQMPVQTPPQMPVQQTPPVQMPTQHTPVQQTPPVQTPPQMPVQTPVQMPAQQTQTYTVEQIGRAARPLVEGGRQQELVALLAEFGVVSVAALPEEARAAFVQRIRAMGAQI